MTDPIADMFTRIRNASLVRKPDLVMPMSKIKLEIAKILEKEGWISKFEVLPSSLNTKRSQFDQLRIVLKYQKNGLPVISNIKRVSKPGARIYLKKDNLPTVLNNLGIALVSTSSGIMTNKEAFYRNLGGEILGEIY